MIEVDGLSKWYGDFQALRDVTFSVGAGGVAGFLGANGAGKTTTMRILACFLPATSGRAAVGGFDVFTQGLAVRQVLGYMPQSSPLYPDMRVAEYLRFMAEMRDVAAGRIDAAVDESMEKAGLLRPEDMHRRLIGTLSGGYRQRVGLAAAMLHKPKVLILDEPTAGLDPVEIRNAREVIRGLAREHTVLLSTHILSEVQQVCSKVIIIHGGRVVADAPMTELVAGMGECRVRLAVDGPPEHVLGVVREVPGVREARLVPASGGAAVTSTVTSAVTATDSAGEPSGAGRGGDETPASAGGFPVAGAAADVELLHDSRVDVRPEVGRRLAMRSWPVLAMQSRQDTLEDIYVRMTRAER